MIKKIGINSMLWKMYCKMAIADDKNKIIFYF